MDVSIIIVNYNTKNLLKQCLDSIYNKTRDITFEIIVSDNGSRDGSIEMLKTEYPKVILIENNENLGFGTANNRGLEVSKGKYIFYLNSDTILKNNAVKIFYDYFEENDKKETPGALGCNLLDNDGNINSSYSTFPDINKNISDLIHANYGLSKLLIKKIFGKALPDTSRKKQNYERKTGEVDFIVGADLFLKNDNYAKFDENIFLYYEEVDLQYQLYKAEKKMYLIDGPQIIHLEGQSSKNQTYKHFEELTSFSAKFKNISRIYYYRKNISIFKSFIIQILTVILWLNPLIIQYNFKAIPLLFKNSIKSKDISKLVNNGV